MNYIDFFKEDNKSGWKCVESKLFNKHPDIHELISNNSELLGIKHLKFVIQIWFFINEVKDIPKCKECSSEVKFLRLTSGYQEFCSIKCSNKNEKKISTTKNNLISKHGVNCSLLIPDVLSNIRYNKKPNIGDCDDMSKIKELFNKPDYSISYEQKIITKETIKKYIDVNGKEKLNEYIPLLLRFIREFQPKLPYPDSNETLEYIIDGINKFDFSRFHNKENNTFNNNTYNIGVGYLKGIFKSYWNSSYKGCLTPEQYWCDDINMKRIIAYIIGLNKSGEIFDFSLRNLVRGISAVRGTVSFFKPIVASGIYKHYLGGIDNPTVFDPCCGFGGRLLGFKSIYPNGKYIGCEPNITTYNELSILGDRFNNIEINNCKLEDYKYINDYDLAFTSIPYFDLEDYNNGVKYKDFDEWKDLFVAKLLTYPKLVINMNYDLCDKLGLTKFIDGYLINSKSYFNNCIKEEVLLKINF